MSLQLLRDPLLADWRWETVSRQLWCMFVLETESQQACTRGFIDANTAFVPLVAGTSRHVYRRVYIFRLSNGKAGLPVVMTTSVYSPISLSAFLP